MGHVLKFVKTVETTFNIWFLTALVKAYNDLGLSVLVVLLSNASLDNTEAHF